VAPLTVGRSYEDDEEEEKKLELAKKAAEPEFKDAVERSRWEEEQRSREMAADLLRRRQQQPQQQPKQRVTVDASTPPAGSPAAIQRTASSTGMAPRAAESALATKLRGLREEEERRGKLLAEVREAEARKRREAEDARKAKQFEQHKARQQEREQQERDSSANAARNTGPSIVKYEHHDPMEELRQIREKAAGSSDSYFANSQ